MRNPALQRRLEVTANALDAFEVSQKATDFRAFRRSRAPTLDALDALEGIGPWKGGIDALLRLPTPSMYQAADWDALCWRVLNFAVEWADDGLRYGWTMLDMFGCNPDPAARRVDRNGVAMTLVRMLSPLTVAAVDNDGWHLADQRGSLLRYPRMNRQGQVLIWDAYSAHGGP
jgi:hypothetical protein